MSRSDSLVRRADLLVGAATTAVVGALLVLQVLLMPTATAPDWLEVQMVFARPHSRAEAMVARMDGHFAAELAADPTLARTRRDFAADPADGAYRSTRPVLGWMAWGLSAGGRRPALAPALLLLTALSAGALTVAVCAAGRTIRGRPRWPAMAALAPGAAIAVVCPGLTEVLATALALGGFALHRRGRAGPAVVLLAVGVLTRETVVLVAAGLALADLIARRRAGERWAAAVLRSAPVVAVPAGAYLAWNLIVAALLGRGSAGGGANQLTLPGVGLVQGLGFWGPLELLTFALLVGAAVVLWRSGDLGLRAVLVANAVFASLMNRVVWAEWWGFGRVLLPVMALAVAAGAFGWSSADTEGARDDGARAEGPAGQGQPDRRDPAPVARTAAAAVPPAAR